ncbi:probable serine/threonine protein kinase IREH1 [Syzygium oleosum]|uniref:probable serine/threonine protein kinase IREH1 n=1 Tax=Syzygium oleosum TaxID=219896 RepID=UPI0011D1AAE2|nr:probable serine/threonine protein kinase IREH1 [Syzygium oleosum]XP_056173466.1 probable serine/threonine protein kinase IREH1 [Syzygium oleosum]XP_056173469.1 probable serine/threonine protein kinase IREH1 [Syzygium oleosum]
MVFKGRFFSSKKSDSSSPDGSNSPRSLGSNSPIRSDKRKPKPASKLDDSATSAASAAAAATSSSSSSSGFPSPCRQTQVKDGQKKKDARGKEPEKPSQAHAPQKHNPVSFKSGSSLGSKSKKGTVAAAAAAAATATGTNPVEEKEAPSSVSPILASSLGLNRIKTRSGPLPQESFFGFRGEKGSGLGASNLSRPSVNVGDRSSGSANSSSGSGGKKKEVEFAPSRMGVPQDNARFGNWVENGTNSDGVSPGSVLSRDQSPNLPAASSLANAESSSEAGHVDSSWGRAGDIRSSDVCTPEESESPRFQAILRVTSAPKKRFPGDIKSFSHELNSKGVRPFPFWKPRGLNNLEEILVVIRTKFDKAKEEVNSDLAIFAADLVGILEKNAETHPEWQETIEDLLVLARSCAMTSPGEFWLQCEGIVQELDDRRQELPMGILKQLHTRMLFILTRCTRLLQFHKESGLAEDEQFLHLRQSRVLHSADKRFSPSIGRDGKSLSAAKPSKAPSSRKSYSQEQQHGLEWKRERPMQRDDVLSPPANDTPKNESPGGRNRMASWKKLPTPAGKALKESVPAKEHHDSKVEPGKAFNNRRGMSDGDVAVKSPELLSARESSKHQHKASWGYWGDQAHASEESTIICRICEEEVLTSFVEDHSRICAVADRCDQKGINVNERLLRISETLEKMMETFQKDAQHVGSPDVAKVSNSSVTEESDIPSPKLSDWSRRGSEDMLDCFQDVDNSIFMDDMKGLPSMSCRTRFGLKSDQGMTTSSAGSMTPRSPGLTPRTSQIDLLLAGKGAFSENEDFPQMNELADIARCVASTPMDDERSSPFLLTCLEDLRMVIDRRKFDALTVETFGTRIEKLIREKYLQLCELVDDEKVDITSTVIDEDAPLEDDVVRSLRTSPVHSSKDRTSIDDFEIIKPISRGAFGRVFLAKKRTTGDLFAIKVLKKADMIRKNAVESILAERDILISVRNPFVVRFFYSFTCRENLYLVMEYLNGGDLYSLLRNLGCLDEEVARVYIAEVVLALEYLHSLRVVHRDLKPDNLLIAHDGHIKLTDFGLSKVGLINSTDDLSGPAVSGTSMLVDEEPELSMSESQKERRKKRSAVGTPDYLAPEILLGTGHGTTADWWSVGVILFELIVGIPPFNAEHPQTIFDNILNRNIPWPRVPEEMSAEAQDLIDRLLTEDPHQRLGASGAWEVKQHVFFKDINWDTLARQKAAFVPSSESALDTSYFTSRYSWNTSDEQFYPDSEFEDLSDEDSLSGSSCLSNRQEEVGDEFGGLAEFESGSSINYSFSNFSFKNLSQLASINYDLLSKGWKDDPPPNSGA